MSFITGVGLTSYGRQAGPVLCEEDVAGFRHSGAVQRTEPGTGILSLAC